ncbi:DUF2218 domain-containing protein [Acuticoccus mangrovi]|uniref:DUF2218 domain-containing protein n=1 Tax=Acuticoccus mangrovi TaxID=2796142 RepID=A0A934ITV0_9HYPH|nr:DUF2218 domain-containing protein [Acuticoccus mangrovi]MBJ3778640.1 DUF2218 domain-containing protein [Acuticoccus mangrovi]
MNPAQSDVATPHASRYLSQLLKHFAHKLPVEMEEGSGRIAFPAGVCSLAAEPDVLHMRVDAVDDAECGRLMNVVERHLVRFAFRETLSVDWRTAAWSTEP